MRRLSPFVLLAKLVLITVTVATLPGCATRVLMSSDRYDNPQQTQPYRPHETQSHAPQQKDVTLEQAYLVALD
jgi:hypothetical protein